MKNNLKAAQPVAWLVSCPDDEIYGRGPDKLQFHPLAQHDIDYGYRAKPLYASPPSPEPDAELLETLDDMFNLINEHTCPSWFDADDRARVEKAREVLARHRKQGGQADG